LKIKKKRGNREYIKLSIPSKHVKQTGGGDGWARPPRAGLGKKKKVGVGEVSLTRIDVRHGKNQICFGGKRPKGRAKNKQLVAKKPR